MIAAFQQLLVHRAARNLFVITKRQVVSALWLVTGLEQLLTVHNAMSVPLQSRVPRPQTYHLLTRQRRAGAAHLMFRIHPQGQRLDARQSK